MTDHNTDGKRMPSIHAVEGFHPSDYARTITGEDGTTALYLDVKYRMLWFRLCYPEGKLDTEIQTVTDQYAVVCCRVYTNKSDPADQYIAKSVALRFISRDRFGDRFLEVAETAAIGRALAAAGFGTQFCSGSEVPDVMTDAPVARVADGQPELSENRNARTEALPQTSGQTDQIAICEMASEPDSRAGSGVSGIMTLEEAKKVTVDFGKNRGSTLGQIALVRPGDLQWYVDHYAGANQQLRDGAALLIDAGRKLAG